MSLSVRRHFREPHWRFVLGGSAWVALGEGVNRGSILVSGLVLARVLTTDEFGRYGILRSLLFVVTGVVSMGMATVATRSVGLWSKDDPGKAGRVIGTTLAFSLVAGASAFIVIVASSRWIASLQFGKAGLWPLFAVVAVNIFLAVQVGTLTGVLLGLKELRYIGVSQFTAGVALLPVVWLSALAAGLVGAMLGMAVSQAVLVVALARRVNRGLAAHGIRTDWRGYRREWRVVPHQGAPLLLAALLVSPAILIVQTLLANGPGGLADVAVFSLALVWATVITVPAGLVGQPNMSALVNARSSGHSVSSIAVQGGLIQIAVALLTAAVLALAAPFIMAAHGQQYKTATTVLLVLIIGYVITYIGGMADTAATAIGNLWLVLMANMVWATVFVAASAVWGVDRGPIGVAWCFVLAYAVKSFLQMMYLRRLLRSLGSQADPDVVTGNP